MRTNIHAAIVVVPCCFTMMSPSGCSHSAQGAPGSGGDGDPEVTRPDASAGSDAPEPACGAGQVDCTAPDGGAPQTVGDASEVTGSGPAGEGGAGPADEGGGAGGAATGVVPCPLTAAAESCWAAHTGVVNWTGFTEAQIVAGQSTLLHVTGAANAPSGTAYTAVGVNGGPELKINADGTTLDRIWFDGCISVTANNVTIKSSLIRSDHACQATGDSQAVINIPGAGSGSMPYGGTVIEDVTVDAMNANYDAVGIGAAYFTCIRCNVYAAVHDYWAGASVTIKESYGHDLLTPNPDKRHTEVIDADTATNVLADHDYLRATGGDGFVTGAFMNGGSYGDGHDVTLNNSYIEGLAGADLETGCGNDHTVITGNAFSSNNGYSSTDYVYGYDPQNPGMVWTGNTIPETGATLPEPTGDGGCS